MNPEGTTPEAAFDWISLPPELWLRVFDLGEEAWGEGHRSILCAARLACRTFSAVLRNRMLLRACFDLGRYGLLRELRPSGEEEDRAILDRVATRLERDRETIPFASKKWRAVVDAFLRVEMPEGRDDVDVPTERALRNRFKELRTTGTNVLPECLSCLEAGRTDLLPLLGETYFWAGSSDGLARPDAGPLPEASVEWILDAVFSHRKTPKNTNRMLASLRSDVRRRLCPAPEKRAAFLERVRTRYEIPPGGLVEFAARTGDVGLFEAALGKDDLGRLERDPHSVLLSVLEDVIATDRIGEGVSGFVPVLDRLAAWLGPGGRPTKLERLSAWWRGAPAPPSEEAWARVAVSAIASDCPGFAAWFDARRLSRFLPDSLDRARAVSILENYRERALRRAKRGLRPNVPVDHPLVLWLLDAMPRIASRREKDGCYWTEARGPLWCYLFLSALESGSERALRAVSSAAPAYTWEPNDLGAEFHLRIDPTPWTRDKIRAATSPRHVEFDGFVAELFERLHPLACPSRRTGEDRGYEVSPTRRLFDADAAESFAEAWKGFCEAIPSPVHRTGELNALFRTLLFSDVPRHREVLGWLLASLDDARGSIGCSVADLANSIEFGRPKRDGPVWYIRTDDVPKLWDKADLFQPIPAFSTMIRRLETVLIQQPTAREFEGSDFCRVVWGCVERGWVRLDARSFVSLLECADPEFLRGVLPKAMLALVVPSSMSRCCAVVNGLQGRVRQTSRFDLEFALVRRCLRVALKLQFCTREEAREHARSLLIRWFFVNDRGNAPAITRHAVILSDLLGPEYRRANRRDDLLKLAKPHETLPQFRLVGLLHQPRPVDQRARNDVF